MLVLLACGKCGSKRCTTNITNTLRDSAEPSSNANSTSFNTSSCIAKNKKKVIVETKVHSFFVLA